MLFRDSPYNLYRLSAFVFKKAPINHCALLFSFLLLTQPLYAFGQTITVGSKRFTENLILGEIYAQLLEDKGFHVKRKLGLGGTMVAFRALEQKEIDVYPEYTGTLAKAIFQSKNNHLEFIRSELSKKSMDFLQPLGFENTYCLIMKKSTAQKLKIKKISDLSSHPHLKGGLSFEFQERSDGWKQLRKIYFLKNQIKGVEIPLTYKAVKNNKVDFAEAYSTEPMIKKMNFTILDDDQNFFPKYEALTLFHKDFPKKAREVLKALSGRITNEIIVKLNSMAVSGESIPKIANAFLKENNFISDEKKISQNSFWLKTYYRTKIHLFLTGFAVFLATLIALPFAFLSANSPKLSKLILGFAGVFQTIPSIALLAFMIPIFRNWLQTRHCGAFYLLSSANPEKHLYCNQPDRSKTHYDCKKHRTLSHGDLFFWLNFPWPFPPFWQE